MEALGRWEPRYVPGRRKPLYYYQLDGPMAILGHYETPCGGCDTIGSAAEVFRLLEKVRRDFPKVLCEGLLLSEDVKWSARIPQLRVLFLTTAVETCLQRIQGRRASVGNDKPLNPHNTVHRVQTIYKARLRLLEKGVPCYRKSVEQAVPTILAWLTLT